MITTPRSACRGFTLLEMSIVLIIIGLLIGGVLGMRSYLNNAERSTMMNEAKYYIAAFGQFQERYGAPPGDFCSLTDCSSTSNASPTANLIWPSAYNGDGNGIIRAPASAAFTKERFYTFQHLALAGFIQGTYTGAANSNGGATIGENVPGTSIDKVAFLFDHPDAEDGNVSSETQYFDSSLSAPYDTAPGLYNNVLIVARNADNSSSVPNGAFLAPKHALQLDEKFDDAIPVSGWILVSKSNSNCYDTSTNPDSYVTTASGENCYFILKMP